MIKFITTLLFISVLNTTAWVGMCRSTSIALTNSGVTDMHKSGLGGCHSHQHGIVYKFRITAPD